MPTKEELTGQLLSKMNVTKLNRSICEKIDQLNVIVKSNKWTNAAELNNKYFHVQLAEWLRELISFKESVTFVGIQDWYMELEEGIKQVTPSAEAEKSLSDSDRKEHDQIKAWLLELYFYRKQTENN